MHVGESGPQCAHTHRHSYRLKPAEHHQQQRQTRRDIATLNYYSKLYFTYLKRIDHDCTKNLPFTLLLPKACANDVAPSCAAVKHADTEHPAPRHQTNANQCAQFFG